VITAGLFLGLLVCGKRVVQGDWSVGDFVGFITYLLQLYQPLNWFGTYYRVIQQNFVDMEKMMQVFEQEGDLAILVENESTSFPTQSLQRSRGIVFGRFLSPYTILILRT
jgi:ABC-type transport system involved in Fe-S cluster assembly fused permease/ATPase subunit